MRTSACGIAASKRLLLAHRLLTPGFFDSLVDDFAEANPFRRDRIDAYRRLLNSGEIGRVIERVAERDYVPAPPVPAWINKAGKAKKRIYLHEPVDELLLRGVNRAIAGIAAEEASPLCHSFIPGRGARTALRSLLRGDAAGGDGSAWVKLDIHDYFNSLDPDRVIDRLPERFAEDRCFMALARSWLLTGPRAGVRAGTPLAPVLAALALRDLDRWFEARSITYCRYSDDMIAFGPVMAVSGYEHAIRDYLGGAGLSANESKTARGAPGSPWEYLGLRYDGGTIDLATRTITKFKAKTRRLARRSARGRRRFGDAPHETAQRFVARLNRRIYGCGREGEFSWARWFLPVLTTPQTLHDLDRYTQQQVRWAAAGIRSQRAASAAKVPYEALRAAGYRPLVAEYWLRRSTANRAAPPIRSADP